MPNDGTNVMCTLADDANITDDDIEAAIDRLPPRQAEAFRLVTLDKLSLRKAGEAMGVSQVAVLKNLRKARYNLGCILVAAFMDTAIDPDCAA